MAMAMALQGGQGGNYLQPYFYAVPSSLPSPHSPSPGGLSGGLQQQQQQQQRAGGPSAAVAGNGSSSTNARGTGWGGVPLPQSALAAAAADGGGGAAGKPTHRQQRGAHPRLQLRGPAARTCSIDESLMVSTAMGAAAGSEAAPAGVVAALPADELQQEQELGLEAGAREAAVEAEGPQRRLSGADDDGASVCGQAGSEAAGIEQAAHGTLPLVGAASDSTLSVALEGPDGEGAADSGGGSQGSGASSQSRRSRANGTAANARPPCAFFLKTGTCAYGDSCKFAHPYDLAPRIRFNALGLPLRPGEPLCAYYMQHCRQVADGAAGIGGSGRTGPPHP